MTAGPLVVVGDVLLDREVQGSVDRLCPEAPVPVLSERAVLDRPGGAGLAALFAAVSDEVEVVVVAAFSHDEAGERARTLLTEAGVRVVALTLHGPTPEKIRLRAAGHLLLRLDRGDGGGSIGPAPAEAVEALRDSGAILVSDYGRGVAAHPEIAVAVASQAARVPVVWDPHPKGPAPVAGARLVTPNRGEAAGFAAARPAEPRNGNGNGKHRADPTVDAELASAASDAVRLRRLWSAGAVAVTLAERGAVLSDGVSPPLLVPAPFAANGDPCGAGDRFASAAAATLAAGATTLEGVRAAVGAATAFVAAGGALSLFPELSRPSTLARSV